MSISVVVSGATSDLLVNFSTSIEFALKDKFAEVALFQGTTKHFVVRSVGGADKPGEPTAVTLTYLIPAVAVGTHDIEIHWRTETAGNTLAQDGDAWNGAGRSLSIVEFKN